MSERDRKQESVWVNESYENMKTKKRKNKTKKTTKQVLWRWKQSIDKCNAKLIDIYHSSEYWWSKCVEAIVEYVFSTRKKYIITMRQTNWSIIINSFCEAQTSATSIFHSALNKKNNIAYYYYYYYNDNLEHIWT